VDNGNNGLDGVVPRSILERARGFAIFSVVKAGFIVSARAGSGVVIARLNDGCASPQHLRREHVADLHAAWSAPSAIGTAGMGVGTQAGAEVTDFLIVLNTRAALVSFSV
jgi:lipid-binding SYLF domain-containing protein